VTVTSAAATSAASTRSSSPSNATTTWPSHSRVLSSTLNIECLPASAARRGPGPAASSPALITHSTP